MPESLRVIVAPDSFKGTMSAAQAASAIGEGWLSERPHDQVVMIPQADGGEGTATALQAADADSRWISTGDVAGPDGRPVEGRYLLLGDGTAVVELAEMSGITLMESLDPHIASTRGFGQVIRHALRAEPRRLVLCLGGSASNDGGAGAMQALGAELLDSGGAAIPPGGAALHRLREVRLERACPPPPDGVLVLSDVRAPLLGETGATAVFGPQKGIASEEQAYFEAGLQALAAYLDVDPWRNGMGAAGGTAFGLAALWDLEIASGAAFVADATGLSRATQHADVLITGEGRYDGQSSTGKVVGYSATLAEQHSLRFAVVAGCLAAPVAGMSAELAELAGGVASAMSDPDRYAVEAGAALARLIPT